MFVGYVCGATFEAECVEVIFLKDSTANSLV